MKNWGVTSAIIGAVVLGGLVACIGYSAITHKQNCDGVIVVDPKDNRALIAEKGKFSANGKLCLAWRPHLYFKKEIEARQILEAELAAAKVTENTARTTAETDRTAASETRYKTMQTARVAVETKIAALPSSAVVAVFVDGIETEATFPARVPVSVPQIPALVPNKPPPIDSSVVWQPVSLRAPEDSGSEAAKDWRELLRGIGRDGSRPVKVALGDKEAALPRAGVQVDTLRISAFEPAWLAVGVVGFLLLVIGLFRCGWDTALLRVATPSGPNTAPFSLARVQMALWFSLTLGGFLFIWLTSGQWMGLMTSGVLGLLGISGVSGLASIAIDQQTGTTPLAQLPSKGFWKDVLSDGDSIVLHRVQMFTWTVVLGLIFIWSVMWNYTFPTFDSNLLILAGIVNGVYLGFKFPENK